MSMDESIEGGDASVQDIAESIKAGKITSQSCHNSKYPTDCSFLLFNVIAWRQYATSNCLMPRGQSLLTCICQHQFAYLSIKMEKSYITCGVFFSVDTFYEPNDFGKLIVVTIGHDNSGRWPNWDFEKVSFSLWTMNMVDIAVCKM